MRLEQFLKNRMGFSARQIRRAKFLPSGICVNGQRSRVSAILREGDLVSVLLDDKAASSAMAEKAAALCREDAVPVLTEIPASPRSLRERQDIPAAPDILYEDEDILAVNKPAGMAVHPAHGHYADTLADQVMAWYLRSGSSCIVRPVGRLDLETSGIVLFAKNAVAAARLSRRDKGHSFMRKTYLAVAEGSIDDERFDISLPIAPCEGHLNRMYVVHDPCSKAGKTAVTMFRVLIRAKQYTVLEAQPITGRTHQIRVHLADAGHPLLGDRIYGTHAQILPESFSCPEMPPSQHTQEARSSGTAKSAGTAKPEGAALSSGIIKRAALHCHSAVFCHPFTGETLRILAPLPEDMKPYCYCSGLMERFAAE